MEKPITFCRETSSFSEVSIIEFCSSLIDNFKESQDSQMTHNPMNDYDYNHLLD